MLWRETGIGVRKGKLLVLNHVLVQQRCARTPVPDDENRRVLDFDLADFATVAQRLHHREAGIEDAQGADDPEHGNTGRSNAKLALGCLLVPGAHRHAVPKARMPEPVGTATFFLFLNGLCRCCHSCGRSIGGKKVRVDLVKNSLVRQRNILITF